LITATRESDNASLAANVRFSSLADLLRYRGADTPHERAYVSLGNRGGEEDALTFADLLRRAGTVARRLGEYGRKGDRALLLFPPGLDFIVAFFGCMLAGIIAVPMMVPRRASTRDSSETIRADCSPCVAMTNAALLAARPDVVARYKAAGLEWLILEAEGEAAAAISTPKPDREDLAVLQYTSGSTSAPKGVMVSHGSLLDNLEMIKIALGNTRRSTYVSWVPPYHDMGLVLNILQSLYVGALCVVMAPAGFAQRPLSWLRAIHDYRAEVSCGPNFAFDLCASRFRADQMAGIDLSGWKLALNGAEPVRPETIERFASTFADYGFDPAAMYPAYGMAEATLLIAGGKRGAGPVTRLVDRDALQRHRVTEPTQDRNARVLIGCGRKLAGERLAIVNSDSRERLAAGRVGEIWVSGPNVAKGYWNNPEATAAVFEVRIEGEGPTCWLRTGDLGFLDEAGELYITGRIKDVIIVRGINHYPQDIESTVQDSHPALRRDGGAAIAVEDEGGQEKLVIVQEVERSSRHQVSLAELADCIREAIANEHEIVPHEIVLVRSGTIPKTTSGKIQRRFTHRLWSQGRLESLS
jgi:acyl-CoA synthetase (AMP-forming)/AMP-acid ligase II